MAAMFDLLDQPAEIVDRPGARPLRVDARARSSSATSASATRPSGASCSGSNLTVEPGQTVAVVGPSGAGKSTIGRLLFRFYDVTGGAVLIDGQDIRDVTQASLRAAIGIVPAGHGAVQRHHLLQHRLRPARRDPRRGRGGGAGGAIHDFVDEAAAAATTRRSASAA